MSKNQHSNDASKEATPKGQAPADQPAGVVPRTAEGDTIVRPATAPSQPPGFIGSGDPDTTAGRTNPHLSTPQSPDGKTPPSPGGDSLAAKQLELEERERDLARREAAADARARESLQRDQREGFLRSGSPGILGGVNRGEVANAVGTLLEQTAHEPTPFDHLAVDRTTANRLSAGQAAKDAKSDDHEKVLRESDFETIGKIRTANGYVPARTRIPAGSMPVEELRQAWEKNVVRPYQPPPPPGAPKPTAPSTKVAPDR